MIKRMVKKAIRKAAPGLPVQLQKISSIDDRLVTVEGKLDKIHSDLSGHDFRIDRLRELASRVEPYQPAYGLAGVIDSPRRQSRDRCLAIESALRPIAGKRVLDVGSSLGYVSFYLADRGARVEGWESNMDNAEVSRLIGELNGIKVEFKTKEINDETVQTIQRGQFDVAIVLSVFHHITHFHGLEYTQQLVKDLMDRVPVVVTELAKRGEDKNLFWDAAQPDDELAIFDLVKDEVDIKKIGEFGNHLSENTRPLYVVSRKSSVEVGGQLYGYDYSTAEAYKDSPVAHRESVWRRYYFAKDYIIKEYSLNFTENPDNAEQIIAEINALTNFAQKFDVYHSPKLLNFAVEDQVAKVVIERVKGDLLSDLAASPLPDEEIVRIARDILQTLADLEKINIHHNDVRSWNVVYSKKKGAWLIDYGLAGPVDTDNDIVALMWMLRALERGERESYEQGKAASPPSEDFRIGVLRKFAKKVGMGERSPIELLKMF